MGNCCSYVLPFETNNSTVADPLALNDVKGIVEKEALKGLQLKKSQTVKQKNQSSLPKDQKNDGLILPALPKRDYPNPSVPINLSPKKDESSAITKTQTLKVNETNLQNLYLSGSGSKTVQSSDGYLNPNLGGRKDQRALTAREEENNSVVICDAEEKIKVEDLKINDVILKKISKLTETAEKDQAKMKEQGPLRSQTLGDEEKLFDDDEGTGTKKKDEMKKSFIEAKENVERQLEKKPSKMVDELEKSRSVDKKPSSKSNLPQEQKSKEEPLPRKSLLKRFKTIGDEKSKKKVKFKDLFDSRGKKKVKRKKRP